MQTRKLPFLRNISLMMTFRCNSSCSHCAVQAGPDRTEEIDIEESLLWIEQAARYRGGHIRGLTLTGGEPFYSIDMLQEISSLAKYYDMFVSVVTNGFWAKTTNEAIRVLRSLPAIEMVSLSTDVYHQESVPLTRVINAIEAARECGLEYSVAVCTANSKEAGYQRILAQLSKAAEDHRIRRSLVFPVGRSKKWINPFDYQTSAKPCESACFTASSPVIFPNGEVHACIGPVLALKNDHPLILGNLYKEHLHDILNRAEENVALHTIRVWGPGRIIRILREYGLADLLPHSSNEDCICDCCYKIMSQHRLLEAISDFANSRESIEQTAYDRAYFLNEDYLARSLPCQPTSSKLEEMTSSL